MNRPSPLNFLLGARASVALTTGAAALTSFVWATKHTLSWPVPAIALALCKASYGAKKRVTVWRTWTGAWDEMAGAGLASQQPQARPAPRRAPANVSPNAPPQQQPEGPPPKKPLRIPRAVLITGWIVLLAWLKAHQGEAGTPALGLGALCFFALTLWGLVAACVGFGRWLLRPASLPKARSAKMDATNPTVAERESATDADGNHIVAQCLAVPRDALPSGHVRDVLPDYCAALLARAPGKQASGE